MPKDAETGQCRSADAQELVTMLGAITAQIEMAIYETHEPMSVLVGAAHSMGDSRQLAERCMSDIDQSPEGVFETLGVLRDELDRRATAASSAIQFHDRLVQCLSHACANLTSLSRFMASHGTAGLPADWLDLKIHMRKILSTEQERHLFDFLLPGAEPPRDDPASAGHPGGDVAVELF